MKRTTEQLRSNYSITGVSIDSTQQMASQQGEEDFFSRLQGVWDKVLLLKEVGIVENEQDKFSYAYRLAEIELQKLCRENASLREQVNELLISH